MNKMTHLTFAKIEIRKMNQKWKSQVKNGDEKQKAEVENIGVQGVQTR